MDTFIVHVSGHRAGAVTIRTMGKPLIRIGHIGLLCALQLLTACPSDEVPEHKSPVTSASAPAAPEASPQAVEVERTYLQFRGAVLHRRAHIAATTVDQHTMVAFERIRTLALTASRDELGLLAPFEATLLLQLRSTADVARVRALDGADVFDMAVTNDWLVELVTHMDLSDAIVDGETHSTLRAAPIEKTHPAVSRPCSRRPRSPVCCSCIHATPVTSPTSRMIAGTDTESPRKSMDVSPRGLDHLA